MNNEKEMQNIMHEISCFKCSHFAVCIYFRGVQQIVSSPDEEGKKFQPFQPENIAKICKFYLPDPFT
jgi:hypothetical protein